MASEPTVRWTTPHRVETNVKVFADLRKQIASLDNCKHLDSDRKNTVLGRALEKELPAQAVRYNSCGQDVIPMVCDDCGTVIVAPTSCHLRICARCMERKAIQYANRVIDILKKLGQLRFITLTLPAHVDLNRITIDHLRKSFIKFKNHPAIAPLLAQHVYFIEATPKADGWHLHIHILAAGKYIPHALIKKVWWSITGASIVHITARGSVRQLLMECMKYCLKASRIVDPKDAITFLKAFKGVRMFQSCKGLHPLPIQDGRLLCPHCNHRSWRFAYGGETHQALIATWKQPTLHPEIPSIIVVWPSDLTVTAEDNYA